jgi:hypothetical protein
MFELFELVGLVGAVSAGTIGYLKTRDFVRTRLRYVEAVHNSSAPVKAGGAALLVAVPIVWLLPFVGAPSAIFFAASVAGGVIAGRKDIKRLPGV